jgi:hypothetical protein
VGYLISFAIDRKSYYERMKERLLKAVPGWPPPAEKPQRNGVRGADTGTSAPEAGAGF